MGWISLVAGVGLWWAAHLFKRLAPTRRAAMGDRGKGAVALVLLASIILMVIGYRATPYVALWTAPAFFTHINNLAVLIALFLMSPAPKKGRLLNGMRHPMLLGFSLWAAAHLAVNGDLASVILFGGLLAWSVVTPGIINRADPEWTPPAPGTYAKDAMFAVGSGLLLVAIGFIHNWLGVWPFG